MVEASLPFSSKIENIDLNIKDHEVVVTFFDLSAGESTLIQGPNGENLLVNAGGKKTEAELDRWLYLYDVKEISTLILTNDGEELSHKQINRLILKYNIKEIITTPELSAQLTKNGDTTSKIAVISWGEGTKKVILPELTSMVQFVGNEQNEGMDLSLQFFKHRVFLMTSCSPRAEQKLLKENIEDVNVFKIPNCAKKNSITEKLIQYVNPQISILFAADHHPDPDILHDLYDVWSEVYFTKKHGTVTIKFTDSNYEVITIPVQKAE
jgi:beta-lactamase superfamily II metal-dependent hydrolase